VIASTETKPPDADLPLPPLKIAGRAGPLDRPDPYDGSRHRHLAHGTSLRGYWLGRLYQHALDSYAGLPLAKFP
jgi:hypothetical protein